MSIQSRPQTLSVASIVACAVLAACTQPETAKAPEPAVPAVESTRSKVGFELAAEVTVGALQINVEYPAEGGAFVGVNDAVECTTLIEGALSSYNHVEESHILRAAFVAVGGIKGPVRFAECAFEGKPSAEALKISVVDASAPDLTELAPAPEVKAIVDAG